MSRMRHVASRRHHRARPRDAARLRRRGELVAAARRAKRRPPHRGVRRQRSQPARSAASFRAGPLSEGKFNPDDWMEPKEQRKVDDFIIYAHGRRHAGARRCGLDGRTRQDKQERTGVLIGSGIGGLNGIAETALLLKEKGPRRVSPFFIPGRLINLASGYVSIKHGLKGPNHAVVTACSTGAHAIGDAARLIALGRCRRHGGGRRREPDLPHRRSPALPPAGRCARPSTISRTKASRPYDKDRDGFVMGEGAGIVVLEELEHAKARGARIYAEVIGYGLSGDAYHITAPSEDGDGAYRSHADGAKARRHRGRATSNTSMPTAPRPWATRSSSPPSSGCSATPRASSPCPPPSRPSAICWERLAPWRRSSRCSPSATTSRRPRSISTTLRWQTAIDLVPHKAQARRIDTALSNSFGFGGTNASLVLRRLEAP